MRWYRWPPTRVTIAPSSNLGVMYANGERSQGRPKRRAGTGWPPSRVTKAQYNLGVVDNGLGVLKSRRSGALVPAGSPRRGRYNLGVMYEYGRGVLKDEAEAARWYRLAAAGLLALQPRGHARLLKERRSGALEPAGRSRVTPAPNTTSGLHDKGGAFSRTTPKRCAGRLAPSSAMPAPNTTSVMHGKARAIWIPCMRTCWNIAGCKRERKRQEVAGGPSRDTRAEVSRASSAGLYDNGLSGLEP